MAIPKLQAYALPTAADMPANKVDWAFEPARAALLIHDMQEYFLNFWGEDSLMMQAVVANIKALRDFAKRHDMPVYYRPAERAERRGPRSAQRHVGTGPDPLPGAAANCGRPGAGRR